MVTNTGVTVLQVHKFKTYMLQCYKYMYCDFTCTHTTVLQVYILHHCKYMCYCISTHVTVL